LYIWERDKKGSIPISLLHPSCYCLTGVYQSLLYGVWNLSCVDLYFLVLCSNAHLIYANLPLSLHPTTLSSYMIYYSNPSLFKVYSCSSSEMCNTWTAIGLWRERYAHVNCFRTSISNLNPKPVRLNFAQGIPNLQGNYWVWYVPSMLYA